MVTLKSKINLEIYLSKNIFQWFTDLRRREALLPVVQAKNSTEVSYAAFGLVYSCRLPPYLKYFALG